MRLQALTRKLLRDLAQAKGQALAISAVMAGGVGLYVLMFSTFSSLELTRRTYYERYRMADVFASCKRAPLSLQSDLASVPGVAEARCRVAANVTLDVPGLKEPAGGNLLSIPERRQPFLCDVFIRRGRYPQVGHLDEVLASEGFAAANNLRPGSTLSATINGRKHKLRVVGIALSPEYVYAIRPGEIFPDDRRYGILWMPRPALAASFNMEGAFNDVVLRLMHDADPDKVIAQVDRLIEPYGSTGAVPQRLQISNWYLTNELKQLESWGTFIPLVFLGVASFLVNVVLSRLVTTQKRQIGILKALGYSNAAVAWHYLLWALSVAGVGSVGGVAVGAYFGSGLTRLYTVFFRFPLLLYQLEARTIVVAVGINAAFAVLGALGSVLRAVRIAPAEAMRPEVPAAFVAGQARRRALQRLLAAADRLILRNIKRHPGRAALSVVGIALGCSLLILGDFSLDSFDVIVETKFGMAERYDLLVAFIDPTSARARWEVRHLPGVIEAEGFRAVPVRLRCGHRSRRVVLTGVAASGRLSRVVSGTEQICRIREGGITLSRKLADILGVRPGGTVEVEVLEGRRPTWELPVAGVVEDFIGVNAYCERDTLHRLLQEGSTLSGMYLRADRRQLGSLYRKLKNLPCVSGVMIKRAALESFNETFGSMMGQIRFVYALFSSVIAAGVVYNGIRVALSERMRELATLRVLGFTRREIAGLLFGEVGIFTVVGIPIGFAVGYLLVAIMASTFDFEAWRIPVVVFPRTYVRASVIIVVATLLSILVVRRKLDRLDLVAVLKQRE